MTVQLAAVDSSLRQSAIAALRGRNPKYGEVRQELADIWQLANSENRKVAIAARAQVVNAFQRAPVSHCLHGRANGDQNLSTLIWEPIDGRMARADAGRRSGYRETATAVVGHGKFNTTSKAAALELLVRLKDRKAAAQLIEMLLELPRELWPKAGQSLRNLTGQDFGPRPGDGIAEVVAAHKQWREWLTQERGK